MAARSAKRKARGKRRRPFILSYHQRWPEARLWPTPATARAALIGLARRGGADRSAVDAVLAESAQTPSAADCDAQAALQQLDALLVGPLRTRLANISHVILSPDATLQPRAFEGVLVSARALHLETGC